MRPTAGLEPFSIRVEDRGRPVPWKGFRSDNCTSNYMQYTRPLEEELPI